jgi:hypothetical protein
MKVLPAAQSHLAFWLVDARHRWTDDWVSMNTVIIKALALHLDHVEEDALKAIWDRVETLESKVLHPDAQLNPRHHRGD